MFFFTLLPKSPAKEEVSLGGAVDFVTDGLGWEGDCLAGVLLSDMKGKRGGWMDGWMKKEHNY